MTTGYIGSSTLSVGIVTPVSIGTLTTGTRYVDITGSQQYFYGYDAGIGTDAASILAADTTLRIKVSTTTPVMYFLGNVSTGTVHLEFSK